MNYRLFVRLLDLVLAKDIEERGRSKMSPEMVEDPVCGMRIVTVPSLSITSHALISMPLAVVVDCGRAAMLAANASGM